MLTSSLALALPDRPRVSPFTDAPDDSRMASFPAVAQLKAGAVLAAHHWGRLTAIYYGLVIMVA